MIGLSEIIDAVRSPLGIYRMAADFEAFYPDDLDSCLHVLTCASVDPHSDGWRLAPNTAHDLAELLRRIVAYNPFGITHDATLNQLFTAYQPTLTHERTNGWALAYAAWCERATGRQVSVNEPVCAVRIILMAGETPAHGGN